MMIRAKRRAVVASGFRLLGEVLLVGIVVAVASLALVTAVPSLAAGVSHLRRHLLGKADDVGRLLQDVATAMRRLWPVGVAVPVLLLVLGFNLRLAATGPLPGATAVTAASGALVVVTAVVTLRLVGRWTPDEPWRGQVRAAAVRAWSDMSGSALLAAAVGAVLVFVWMLPPMLLVVGGLLAFAALAVESRWAVRTGEPVVEERSQA